MAEAEQTRNIGEEWTDDDLQQLRELAVGKTPCGSLLSAPFRFRRVATTVAVLRESLPHLAGARPHESGCKGTGESPLPALGREHLISVPITPA